MLESQSPLYWESFALDTDSIDPATSPALMTCKTQAIRVNHS